MQTKNTSRVRDRVSGRRTDRRTLLGFALASALPPTLAGAGSPGPGGGRPLLLEETNTTGETTAVVTRLAGPAFAVTNGDARGIALRARLGPARALDRRDGGAAVAGINNAAATARHQPTGVLGRAWGPASRGVRGETDGGIGVYGRADSDRAGSRACGVAGYGPIGVSASTLPGGTALLVEGRLSFSQADTIEVSAGEDAVDVSSPHVSPSSFMLAVAQGGSAVSVRSVERLQDSFRVYLSAPAPDGGVRVGYLVLG